MAQVTWDAQCSATGTGKASSANLDHVANVRVLVGVVSLGTVAPRSVTVGGVSMNCIASVPNAYYTCYLYGLYVSAAGIDTVTVTYKASTRHAWVCASFVNGDSGSSFYEGMLTDIGSGTSPLTSSLSVVAGTTGRLIIGVTAFGTQDYSATTITIAPGNGETERSEADLAGTISFCAISVHLEEYDSDGAHDVKSIGTDDTLGLRWMGHAFALKPSAAPTSTNFFLVF